MPYWIRCHLMPFFLLIEKDHISHFENAVLDWLFKLRNKKRKKKNIFTKCNFFGNLLLS